MANTRDFGIQFAQNNIDSSYTGVIYDETILVSAAATFTLPTAVGIRGKRFNILNISTGVATANTTSSQTIGEYSATSIALASKGENVWVESDDANWKILSWEMPELSGTVQTTNATVTTLMSFTPPDGMVTLVTARIAARRSTGAEGAGYFVEATFRRSGATVTQIGVASILGAQEDDVLWDGTVDTDGTIIRVRVTGAAAKTINWYAHVDLVQVA